MTPVLLLVGIGWMYVVVMMSVAEAVSPAGSLLGAIFTFVLYGLLPLGIVLYLLATPARRRRRRAREETASASAEPAVTSAAQPDGGGHAPRDAVAPEREEP